MVKRQETVVPCVWNCGCTEGVQRRRGGSVCEENRGIGGRVGVPFGKHSRRIKSSAHPAASFSQWRHTAVYADLCTYSVPQRSLEQPLAVLAVVPFLRRE